MASSKLFSLEGKGLKLDSAADLEPHIKELKDNPDVEEVRFLGNTFGIEASESLAKVLKTKKNLQVSLSFLDLGSSALANI
jgi:Ran GTPase-activating protein 1